MVEVERGDMEKLCCVVWRLGGEREEIQDPRVEKDLCEYRVQLPYTLQESEKEQKMKCGGRGEGSLVTQDLFN